MQSDADTQILGRRFFRTWEQAIVIGLAGAIATGYFAVLSVISIVDHEPRRATAVAIFATVSFGIVFTRLARCGVRTESGNFWIVNPRRTIKLSADEIQGFELGSDKLSWFNTCAVVNRTDESTLTIIGIATPNQLARSDDAKAKRIVAELNSVHQLALKIALEQDAVSGASTAQGRVS